MCIRDSHRGARAPPPSVDPAAPPATRARRAQAYGNRHEAVTSHPALRHLAAGAPALALLAPQPEGVVSMRWALQSGAAVLSRSRKLEYIAANQQVFWPGFRHVLTPGVMHQMRALDANMSLHGAHHLFVEDRIA